MKLNNVVVVEKNFLINLFLFLFIVFIYINLIVYASAQNNNVAGSSSSSKVWKKLNLPKEHMPYFFYSNPTWRKRCLKDANCPFKEEAAENATKCWGYEPNCNKYPFLVECPEDSRGWTNDKNQQKNIFWTQGDFGYIKERLGEMKTYCKAESPSDSSLECVDHLRMCRAKNIYLDFADLNSAGSNDRYREDTFKPGQVGGYCKFNADKFKQQGGHKSPLQSWYSELQLFQSFDKRPIEDGLCDIIINEPTYIIKLDAGVNMYHHFCDFVNLYVTQHANNSFFQNAVIVFYDTSSSDYWSYFSDMWKVFSNKPPIHLRTFDKKNAVFSFLARMRFGLFYNMPLIYGCHGTALFKSFSEHVLHRFKITQEGPHEDKIRVTLLARGTQYRNILNQDQLVRDMKRRLKSEIELNVVTYDLKTTFIEQLRQTHNTDIFMSMHGAGLTHLLFLPDWAAVFEIYNCEDTDCYRDLSRLRGIKYFTWEKENKVYPQDEGKHPQLGTPHKKFTNYSFESEEFIRMVKKMINYVKSNPKYKSAKEAKLKINKNTKEEL